MVRSSQQRTAAVAAAATPKRKSIRERAHQTRQTVARPVRASSSAARSIPSRTRCRKSPSVVKSVRWQRSRSQLSRCRSDPPSYRQLEVRNSFQPIVNWTPGCEIGITRHRAICSSSNARRRSPHRLQRVNPSNSAIDTSQIAGRKREVLKANCASIAAETGLFCRVAWSTTFVSSRNAPPALIRSAHRLDSRRK